MINPPKRNRSDDLHHAVAGAAEQRAAERVSDWRGDCTQERDWHCSDQHRDDERDKPADAGVTPKGEEVEAKANVRLWVRGLGGEKDEAARAENAQTEADVVLPPRPLADGRADNPRNDDDRRAEQWAVNADRKH